MCGEKFRAIFLAHIFTIENPIEISDILYDFCNTLKITMFFMKMSSKSIRKNIFQNDFWQLEISKSISGLHCDFKCEISYLESPARGSHT